MMLRTDMALTTDKEFRKYSQQYAKDEQAFFGDFSRAFSKCVPLLARAALPRTLSDDVLTPCSTSSSVQAHPPRRPDDPAVRGGAAQEDGGPGAGDGMSGLGRFYPHFLGFMGSALLR